MAEHMSQQQFGAAYKGRVPLFHGSPSGIAGGQVQPNWSSHRGKQAFATPSLEAAADHARGKAVRTYSDGSAEAPLFAHVDRVAPNGPMGKSGKSISSSYEVFSPHGMTVTGHAAYVKVADLDKGRLKKSPVELL